MISSVPSPSFATRRQVLRSLRLVAAFVAVGICAHDAQAYSLNGKTWPTGSNIVMQMGLGNSLLPLLDGNISRNTAAAPALEGPLPPSLALTLPAAAPSLLFDGAEPPSGGAPAAPLAPAA